MTYITASLPLECGCLTRSFSDKSMSYSRQDHNFSCQILSNILISVVQVQQHCLHQTWWSFSQWCFANSALHLYLELNNNEDKYFINKISIQKVLTVVDKATALEQSPYSHWEMQ